MHESHERFPAADVGERRDAPSPEVHSRTASGTRRAEGEDGAVPPPSPSNADPAVEAPGELAVRAVQQNDWQHRFTLADLWPEGR